MMTLIYSVPRRLINMNTIILAVGAGRVCFGHVSLFDQLSLLHLLSGRRLDKD